MKKWAHFLAVILLGLLPGWSGASPPALSIGLFPNLSTRLLLETYQPMREFLEQKLGRPVMLYTAPDFSSFVSRTQKGEYDLVITAPHFARLAQTDAAYQPLFAYRHSITASVVVAKNSPISDLGMLKNQKIAFPDRLAIVTMVGLKMLHDKGLEAGKDYDIHWAGTHGNVALAVQRGQTAVGIIGSLPLKQLPEAISQQLSVLSVSPAIDSQMILAQQSLTSEQLKQVKAALLQFEQSPAGQQFFRATSLAGLKPLDAEDLKQLDPYAREVNRMLELPK
jgi:phosphonate transport system substrate-binding protein